MNYSQAVVDGLLVQMQKERSESQMTLGKLIDFLKTLPADTEVPNLKNARSYRGYYADLAFEMESGTRFAGELLSDAQACMGEVFHGYKGGEFVMGRNTPLWIANWGVCGEKLMNLLPLETTPDEF